ncbi:MAG: sulfotransferase family 2 domain-containing protein [Kordiimonadaceae bacterium]|nr:sulfotransferase family 2 domain-containing protein [Kordiimonadaceae bacterium]MBO6569210.1 sulfotransferase family 2 domain-containing protein [Kordiimonadaceae bacterium]MBO6964686.1 sulfotransferase family 2 domain-containing protein [Kordiimonadaceae bacterium]
MIFFHNPKTAGRSAIEMLGFVEDPNPKFIHMTATDARNRIFQEEWGRYYSFAFVRNPWERMVSLYHYHQTLDYGLFQGFNVSHQLARQYEFNEWLTINTQNRAKSAWFGVPQTVWTDSVSQVYRFEKFEENWRAICERFDLTFDPIHKNSTSHGQFRDYYASQRELDMVAEIDAETIKTFDYTI